MGDFEPDLLRDVTKQLPDALDLSDESDDVHVLVTGPGKLLRARIHIHPVPIRVSYSSVQRSLPAILASFREKHDGRAPDLVIHLGMASTRPFYTVETIAHRDGYTVTDVDGRVGYEYGEKLWKEMGYPSALQSGLHPSHSQHPPPPPPPPKAPEPEKQVDKQNEENDKENDKQGKEKGKKKEPPSRRFVVRPSPPDAPFLQAWRDNLPKPLDVRLSHDAGRYLCEYIYFASMALAHREKRDRNVVFLHVPGWTDQPNILNGVKVVTALIKALGQRWIDPVEDPVEVS
ncbi:hypothetical protein FQN57_006154 [Myotisia sp. PD_48]|nr:hypothetical protein FQN57_006154 [Myotisia sp. PD_48]